MLHRRHFLCLAAAALTAHTAQAQITIPPGTKLITLRHADRTGEDLNDTGRIRAQALVGALDGIPIDAIYSPSWARNLNTAVPLAEVRGLTIQHITAENPAIQLMSEGAGKTIVWIGNKGNLQSIWDALAAPEPPPLNYGDLYIIERGNSGNPEVTRQHFGP